MSLDKKIIFPLTLFFIGCDSSSNSNHEFNPPPTLIVNQTQKIDERSIVELYVDATDNGHIESYLWRQVSGELVEITDANNKKATFKAPSLLLSQGEQKLVFEIIVTDNEGAIATEELTVYVQPLSQKPVVTVTEEITGISGAFTILNWQVEGEPISRAELTADDGKSYNIKSIASNSVSFNLPKAFERSTSTTFSLEVEDEDGNHTISTINIISNPLLNYFTEPKLIYEQEKTIYGLSSKISKVTISDGYNGFVVLSFINDRLIANNDFQLSNVNSRSYFIDFNRDGYIDALTTTQERSFDCLPSDFRKFIHINYGDNEGFNEPEVLRDFGCQGTDESIGVLDQVKDVNDDQYFDLQASGSWYVYDDISGSYDVDIQYDSEWIMSNTNPYPTEVHKELFDINADFNTDIIKINEPEFCSNSEYYIYNDYYVCGSLHWQKNKNDGSYDKAIVLDESYGSYNNFKLVDVNQDGKNELVANLSRLVESEDGGSSKYLEFKSRWYQFSNEELVKGITFERISHFIDLYGNEKPYFIDIQVKDGELSYYEYSESMEQPIISGVIELLFPEGVNQNILLVDIDDDNDLDIVYSVDNKIFLMMNTYQ